MAATVRKRPSRRRKSTPRGVGVEELRRFLLGLSNVTAGFSYGMASFLVNGRFFARFLDDDTVLVGLPRTSAR